MYFIKDGPDRQPELLYISLFYIKLRSSAGMAILVSTRLVQATWCFIFCDARIASPNCKLIVSILFQAEYRHTGSLLASQVFHALGSHVCSNLSPDALGTSVEREHFDIVEICILFRSNTFASYDHPLLSSSCAMLY